MSISRSRIPCTRRTFLIGPVALGALFLLTGCGGGNVLGQGDRPSGNGGTNNPPPLPPPPPTNEQRINLVVTNTGNSNIIPGTYPLTGTPNGRFINNVQVRGDYQVTFQGRRFDATFTLANNTNTELKIGDLVDLAVYRLAYTQTGPASTTFFAWRSRSGTARITAIYNKAIYVFELENVIVEPDPSVADNDAQGTFTVTGDGYVVLTA